jgi:hypothetical protein
MALQVSDNAEERAHLAHARPPARSIFDQAGRVRESRVSVTAQSAGTAWNSAALGGTFGVRRYALLLQPDGYLLGSCRIVSDGAAVAV